MQVMRRVMQLLQSVQWVVVRWLQQQVLLYTQQQQLCAYLQVYVRKQYQNVNLTIFTDPKILTAANTQMRAAFTRI